MDLSESPEPRRPHRLKEKERKTERERVRERKRERGGKRDKDTKREGVRRNGEMCCGSQPFQICRGESHRRGSDDKASQQPYGPRGAALLTAIPSSPCWKLMRSLPCP